MLKKRKIPRLFRLFFSLVFRAVFTKKNVAIFDEKIT